MSVANPAAHVDNLAGILPGEEFQIARILLKGAAHANEQFAEGHRWRCRYNGAAIMLLVNRTGHTISVPRDVARYVEVHRLKPADR